MDKQSHSNAVFLNAFFLVFCGACGTPRSARQTVLGLFPQNTSEKRLKNIDFAVALFVHLLVIPKFSKLQKESYFILLSSVEDYFPGYRLHSF